MMSNSFLSSLPYNNSNIPDAIKLARKTAIGTKPQWLVVADFCLFEFDGRKSANRKAADEG